MGVDYNAYIGPYIRATHTVSEKRIDRCVGHDVPPDAVFCPQCGTRKANRFATVIESSAPKRWEEKYSKGEFCNFLHTTSCMSSPEIVNGRQTYLYLPNRHHNELGIPEIDCRKEQEISFEEYDIGATIERFKELFKDEIAYMSQWFLVEVKFGYISYCS